MSQDWEPGPPSLRGMGPSAIGGAIVPFAVYTYLHHRGMGDANSLIIAGVFPALWVLVEWVRRRRVDPIGLIVLFGFAAGVITSVAMGGNAFVLKVRDSAFTSLFGITCLLSLRWRRPVMFFIGRALSAGDDPERVAAYDQLYEFDEGPTTFKRITLMWGIGFLVEAGLRIVLALALPTSVFLVVSGLVLGSVTATLFALTLRMSRAAIRRGRERGLVLPTVPAGREPGEAALPAMNPVLSVEE